MFGRDPRDIHLGIALDGMNPYSEKRSTQSLTPVIVFNYNLPPWMVTKKYFVMLCLLIPTRLSLTGSNFDVFIQPLVDELQQLWSRRGVLTRDARAQLGMSHVNLRAVLMWTLHDFPAYGLIFGLTTKGFKGCHVCGPHTISRRSKILRKNVYCNCHRRYLQEDHYFWGAAATFDGEASHETMAEPLTRNQTIRRGYQSQAYIDGGGTEKDDEFPAKEHGVKRVSALYQLPYWRVSKQSLLLIVLLISLKDIIWITFRCCKCMFDLRLTPKVPIWICLFIAGNVETPGNTTTLDGGCCTSEMVSTRVLQCHSKTVQYLQTPWKPLEVADSSVSHCGPGCIYIYQCRSSTELSPTPLAISGVQQ